MQDKTDPLISIKGWLCQTNGPVLAYLVITRQMPAESWGNPEAVM